MDYDKLSNQGFAAMSDPVFTTVDFIQETTSCSVEHRVMFEHLPRDYLEAFWSTLSVDLAHVPRDVRSEIVPIFWDKVEDFVYQNDIVREPDSWHQCVPELIVGLKDIFLKHYPAPPLVEQSANMCSLGILEADYDDVPSCASPWSSDDSSDYATPMRRANRNVARQLKRASRKLERYRRWLEYQTHVTHVMRQQVPDLSSVESHYVCPFQQAIDDCCLVGRINRRIFAGVRRFARFGAILVERAKRFKWNVTIQGGSVQRIVRDKQQSKIASEKAKAEAKKVPKAEREAEVKSKRDKRNPAFEAQGLGKVALGAAIPAMAFLFKKVIKLVDKTSKMADKADDFLSKIKQVAAKLKKALGTVIWSLPLTLTILWLCRNMWADQPVLAKLAVGALVAIVGPTLWGHIAKFFPGGDGDLNEDIEPQSFGVSPFTKLVITTMTFGFFGPKLFGVNTTDLMRKMSMAERSSGGFSMFTEWAGGAIEAAINWVRSIFGKEAIQLRKEADQELHDWARDVDKAVLIANTDKMQATPEMINGYVQLFVLGSTIKERYRHSPTMLNAVCKYMNTINGLIAPYKGTLNSRNNYRVEPMFLLLGGTPGIGKTCIMLPMAATILKLSGLLGPNCTPEQLQAELWQKGNSEFWNGYASQLALIMDDFGQNRPDATDKENDYASIIKMVSNWACPLNFADVESKGRIYFNSPLILATTNLQSVESPAAVCLFTPSAVIRRISTPYQLFLDPQYQNAEGYLCMTKFDAEREKCKSNEGVDRFPWYMWSVRKHDYATGVTRVDSIPLKQLVLEMASTLKQRIARQSTSQAEMNDYFSGLSAQAGSVFDAQSEADSIDDARPALEGPRAVIKRHLVDSTKWFKECWQRYDAWCKQKDIGFFKGFAMGYIVTVCLILVKDVLKSLLGVVFKSKPKEPVTVQSNRPATKVRVKGVEKVKAQAGNPVIAHNIYANTYKMFVHIHGSDEVYNIGQALFVCDTLAVIPEHYLSMSIPELLNTYGMSEETPIVFKHTRNPAYSFDYTISEFMALNKVINKDGDLAFVNMRMRRAHKDISGSFMTENHLRYVGGAALRIDICNVDPKRGDTHLTYFTEGKVERNIHYSDRKLERGVRYQVATQKGDCGAPVSLVDHSSFMGQALVGLHVAGNGSNVGYCSMISKEMLLRAKADLKIVDDKFFESCAAQGISIVSADELPEGFGGSFLPIGKVEKPAVICPKTSLYKTDAFGIFGPYEYYPARMSPYRDDFGFLNFPMVNATAPYSSPVLTYDRDLIRQATHVAMQQFDFATRNMTRDLWTFEEAVLGVPCAKFRSMPRGTSAGYPYVTEVKFGKKEFFGDGEVYDLTTERCVDLKKSVHEILDMARRNERGAHIFMDFMKDELRSLAKVKAGATRLISSSPLGYSLAFRMMFAAFTSAAMIKMIETGMAPGMCTYTDAARVMSWLQAKGKSVFAGDFKGFDASEQVDVFDEILDYINRWYNDGEENARIRRVLWLELCHSRHVGGIGNN